jgi:hypothetical protein
LPHQRGSQSETAQGGGTYELFYQNGALGFSQWGESLRGGTMQLGRWHHVAVTSAGDSVILYLDGQAVASGSLPIDTPTDSTSLYLGRAPGMFGRSRWLRGDVDEVSVYNRALSAAEIAAIYRAGAAGKCPDTPSLLAPVSQRALPGSSVQFDVRVSCLAATVAYQWQRNGTNLTDGEHVRGSAAASLVLSGLDAADAGDYRVVVSYPGGSVTSSVAKLKLDYCAPPPQGLVAWWPGEGTAADRVGTQNGTLVGTAQFAPGWVGQALHLTNVHEGVSVPDSPALRPQVLTVETWIKGGPQGAERSLLGKFGASGALAYALWTGGNGGSIGAGIAFRVTTPAGSVSSPAATGSVWDDRYHHIAGSYDGNRVRLYVDGAEVGAGTPCHGPIRYGADSQAALFFLGSDPQARTEAVTAYLDEVGLYNRALSATEIASLFAAGLAGKCQDAPLISTHPIDQFAARGGQATFSVAVRGQPSCTYQWRFRGVDLTDGHRVSGASTASLTLVDVQPDDAGLYTVVASNATGSASSSGTLYAGMTPLVSDTLIAANDRTLDGRDLLVSGAQLTLKGRHVLRSLTLANNGLLTCPPGASRRHQHPSGAGCGR